MQGVVHVCHCGLDPQSTARARRADVIEDGSRVKPGMTSSKCLG
jgi:hypothetical protein